MSEERGGEFYLARAACMNDATMIYGVSAIADLKLYTNQTGQFHFMKDSKIWKLTIKVKLDFSVIVIGPKIVFPDSDHFGIANCRGSVQCRLGEGVLTGHTHLNVTVHNVTPNGVFKPPLSTLYRYAPVYRDRWHNVWRVEFEFNLAPEKNSTKNMLEVEKERSSGDVGGKIVWLTCNHLKQVLVGSAKNCQGIQVWSF